MNPLDDRDERQIEAFLSAAARDAAPPDAAFLARLREQSTQVFQASSPSLPLHRRGRFMTARILRVLAASVAVLSILGPSVCWWLLERDSRPGLARVLDNTAQAKSMHCLLVREGESFDVWTEASGRLRRDNPDGTYQIAANGRLWRIDEKANRAASSPSPYHRDPAQLDLLALLGLPVEPDRGALAESQPIGATERDGVEYLVYHLEVPNEEAPVEIEALVDRQTRRLHSLEASKKDKGEAKPFAHLNVLAYNEEVPEEKFVVRDTLTEDGRVGKVADVQGVVSIKPVLRQRWSPVSAHLLLKPGDWLRTDLRGANAADVRLVKRTRLILGPGTLIEVVKPDQIRLIEGELEITVPAKAKLELLGPDKKPIAVKGTQRYRLDRDSLVAVRAEPRWLKAFKGKTSDESIGSLVARVDGRNVPLTVGQHKVRVTIRDQIARTEIEESFVNHTDGVLEGVFHFPLPDGASVSGFGMWIGDKLVEADIVEKQRAREIYETILQEKRDPGLLEWTGGNIFKARVYPIFAHSEKRIKISYTQVLPFKNGSYRYNYALQSELLQLNPLRELSLDVQIHSAAPLKNVDLSDAHDATGSHRSLGPRRVQRPGIQSDARFRGRRRAGRQAGGCPADPAPPRRRRLFHAATDAARRRRRRTRPAARQRTASPAPRGRHLRLDGHAPAHRAGELHFHAAELSDAEGHRQPGGVRCRMRLGLRESRPRDAEQLGDGAAIPPGPSFAGLDRPRQDVRLGSQAMHAEHARRLRRRRHPHDRRRRFGGVHPASAPPVRESGQDRHLPRRRARQQLRGRRPQSHRVAGRRFAASAPAANKHPRRSLLLCLARSPSRRCAT